MHLGYLSLQTGGVLSSSARSLVMIGRITRSVSAARCTDLRTCLVPLCCNLGLKHIVSQQAVDLVAALEQLMIESQSATLETITTFLSFAGSVSLFEATNSLCSLWRAAVAACQKM